MLSKWSLVVSSMTVLAAFQPTLTQAQAQIPSGGQAFVNGVRPSSALKRIDGGVFQLREREVIDLTDRKILLSVGTFIDRGESNKTLVFDLSVAGSRDRVRPGDRINFKTRDSTRKTFEDKKICVLDVVDFIAPKGAAATATFRFTCQ